MASTILLIDDDPDFITQTRIQLEAAGYNVTTADSVSEAEKVLQSTKPDLAIVDLMLEDTDSGFVLCYQIKKKNPTLPVIMLSGVANETGIEFDAATNEERDWIKADVFLAKPARFEQLKQEIQRLLRG